MKLLKPNNHLVNWFYSLRKKHPRIILANKAFEEGREYQMKLMNEVWEDELG